jgi:hypothetical protein
MNAQGPTDKFWGRMGARGDWLGSRTGETRKRLSPAGIVVKQGNKLVCSVGSPDAYVARLEEDSTITSTGKMFRIPTAAAQNGSGQDVNTGRSVLGLGGLRVIKLKSGNSWIVSKNAQGKTIFLYLLKRTVKQRGRHVFERVRAMVDKEADKTLTDAMVFVVEAKKR